MQRAFVGEHRVSDGAAQCVDHGVRRGEDVVQKPHLAQVAVLGDVGAEKVVAGYNVMGVAKAALEASTRYLAKDLGPRNIRINAISAGPIQTLSARGVSDFSTMLKHHAERAPLGRNVDPREVGNTAVFLCSSMASGITGEVIYVDCGYNIMGI